MDSLERLMYFCGISTEYLNYSGEHCTIPRGDRESVLELMGYDIHNHDAVEQHLYDIDAKPWQSLVLPFFITSTDAPGLRFHVHESEKHAVIAYTVTLESGEVTQGECRAADLAETGEYYIGPDRYSSYLLPLPGLPAGYHTADLTCGERSDHGRLIASPPRCFDPVKDAGEKLWGVSCQLYTLKSERNWGVGDFTDLRELVTASAEAKADMVGINPLHAPCTSSPDYASPYSPSDRRFLNPIYIDIESLPEAKECKPLQQALNRADFKQHLAALRNEKYVDYDRINILKYQCFEWLYPVFLDMDKRQSGGGFKAYCEAKGDTLQQFVEYEKNNNPFAKKYVSDDGFFAWLQWRAEEQFESCQRTAVEQGMAVGLVRDLAVGAVGSGCESGRNTDLFNLKATIGAPPDPFAWEGQDWGLPVLNPRALKAQQYSHFIELLRSNMAHCGALRIDHAMSLLRLWWCIRRPEGNTGVYVYYPLDDLMALLRLESHRNQCLVIGEDLGVVPEDFKVAMAENGLYSNNLFYFERELDGRFRDLEYHQVKALLMVTNHDVPTLTDWWQGTDIRRRGVLGLIQSDEMERQLQERDEDKWQMLSWLERGGFLDNGWDANSSEKAFDLALCSSIHRAAASSSSQLLLMQIEDLQLLDEPINIPGTFREYPNWRRKQGATTAAVFDQPEAKAILAVVDQVRSS